MSFFPFQATDSINSTQAHHPLLGVNIDHIATVRNARGGIYPDPVVMACLAVEAGADIITFHLREDRRHINDDDVKRLRKFIKVPLNFEAAATEEMLGIMEQIQPDHVCLVPERRQEITTEGGLDVRSQALRIKDACLRLSKLGSRVSLFITPDQDQIEASAQAGARCVEFHTGNLASAWWDQDTNKVNLEMQRLQTGIMYASTLGLRTHAGHGLALSATGMALPWMPPADRISSTALVAALPDVMELHIGHALIGHALSVGMAQAVADFKTEILQGKNA